MTIVISDSKNPPLGTKYGSNISFLLLRRTSYEAEGGGDYEVLHLKIDTEDGHAEGVEVTVTGLPGGYPAIDAAGFAARAGADATRRRRPHDPLCLPRHAQEQCRRHPARRLQGLEGGLDD